MKPLILVLALLLAAAPAFALSSDVDLGFDRVGQPTTGQSELAIPHNLGPLTEDVAERSAPFEPPAVLLFTDEGFVVRQFDGAQLAIPNFLNAGETRVDDQYVYPLEFGAWDADLNADLVSARQFADKNAAKGAFAPAGFAMAMPAVPTMPDLAFDIDAAEGDFNACVVACVEEALAASLVPITGSAGFDRADALGGAAALQPFTERLAAPRADARLAPPVSPLASYEAAPSPALAPQGAGPLGALPAQDAALLAAAAAVALGALVLGPLALYSKIRRDMTLVNDTRRTVFEAVVSNPGLSIQEVARRADISHSTAAYHLDRLSGAGLVVATGDGNKVRYYRNGGRFTEQERKLLPCLENVETVRVLEAVLNRPWTYRAEVAQALGVTATTVNWHLKRLFGAGMLSEAREGRSAYLFVDRAALAQACQGLHEKVPDSVAREAAARILGQLGPQTPAASLPDRARLPGPTLIQAVAASVALVPPAGPAAAALAPPKPLAP